MTAYLPVIFEVLVFVAIWLAALAVTAGVRRRVRDEEARPATLSSAFGALAARASLPLVVLALSGAGRWAAGACRLCAAWLPERADHVTAWLLFWGAVLLLAVFEGVAVEFFRLRGRRFPVPDLMRNLLRAVLLIAAAFAILRFEMGVNISPLLASTALVTAVVGFALQGVLGNLLAGMSLHVVGSLAPSDWVSIDGVEGEVIQTNWRETRLRTVAGHLVILPNSTVASAKIHNMTRPTALRRHAVNVGASYSDAPGDVIAALLEAAAAVPEVLRDPPPTAYVTEYKDFGINYTLRFWSHRYHDRTPIEGNVQRMIWYRFKRQGIEIPFPMSDKLLNDFMEVVYTQRRLASDEREVERTARDLLESDFVSRMLVDEKGDRLLGAEPLREVARAVRRVRYTAGEVVFRQGDAGDACHVVVRGKLRGRVDYREGAASNEFDIGPGALFGEMSLVSGLPRTATVTAAEEAELLEVSREAFTTLLSLREDIPQALSRLAAERAAHNAAALEKLQAMGSADVAETIKRENILKRFLRMLGR